MPSYSAGVRLLPNAITVLALCFGLSAVQFALNGQFQYTVAAVGAAALLDALDGRIARMLDATSRIGAELDSLADAINFGVAPALVLYIWKLEGSRAGWVVALVFAVCMVLRLARFNTLLDDTEQPPFAKQFFVGVPAPAAALLAGLPLYLELQIGPGWWSQPLLVGCWALLVAGLMVSRLPTLSLKTVRVPQRLLAPLLVLVGLAGAAVITYPFLALALVAGGYVALLPYTVYRYNWLARHPEAWDLPIRERRATARAARSASRLGLRRPLRRRVAGAARAGAAALGARRRRDSDAHLDRVEGAAAGQASGAEHLGSRPRPRSRRRLGIRSVRRR